MIYIAVSLGVLAVMILCGIAGYIGWYLSHRSFNEGFRLGFETGYKDCLAESKPKKPPLRGV